MHRNVPIKKTDTAKQIVMGEVYIPNQLDSQGEFMTAEGIESAAYSFMRKSQMDAVDHEHDLKASGADVVESFIARKGDPDFTEGAWVVAVHVTGEQWDQVLKGEINGFSMYGQARREERTIEIEVPDDGVVKGDTFDTEGHVHKFTVRVDDQGNFLGGSTDEVDGHSHTISKGTATDTVAGHAHRYDFLEALNESSA